MFFDVENPYKKFLWGMLFLGVPCGVILGLGFLFDNLIVKIVGGGALLLLYAIWVQVCFPGFWKRLFKGPNAE